MSPKCCNEHYTITFFDPSWTFAGEISPIEKIPIYLGDCLVAHEDLELQVLFIRSDRDQIEKVQFKLKSIIKKEYVDSFNKMTEQDQCGFILVSFNDKILLKSPEFTYKMALTGSQSIDHTSISLDIGSYYTYYFNKINKLKCKKLIFDEKTNEAVMYFTAYQGF